MSDAENEKGAETRRAPVAIDARRWVIASALFIPTWFVVLSSLPTGMKDVLWSASVLRPDRDPAPAFLAASFFVYLPLAVAYVRIVRRRFERGDVASPALVSGLLTIPFAIVFLFVLDVVNVLVDPAASGDVTWGERVYGGFLVYLTFGMPLFAIVGAPLGALSAWVMARFARRVDDVCTTK